ncbi:hypothetical protein [Pseudomonas zhanjiangensis]|uniref:Oligosaccharide repeat unit polymerase n=1 Tax=Pseudomonas zhanjiangensis TaxID=3239015 RepID=A0ABV3YW26_9PSED
MVRHFIITWLVYWVAIAVLPVSSIYPAVGEAFLLQLMFVILVLAGYGVINVIAKAPALPQWGGREVMDSKILICVALALSFVGTAFLFYDKIYVQGIDYSRGIAFAREEWRRLGEHRDGQISSAFSVLGYLFSSGYYVAGLLVATVKGGMGQRFRLGVLVCVFVLLMANSLISGGRSNVLLLAVFFLGAVSSREGWRFSCLVGSKLARALLFFMMLWSVFYTLYVFYQRAEASNLTAIEYVSGFLPFLGLEIDQWYAGAMGDNYLSSLLAIVVLAVSYVTHSFSTTAAIIDGVQEDKVIVFLHAMNIFYKLGLVAPPDSSWFLAGRFPSLPGALWYQYGGFCFPVLCFFVGVVCALVRLVFLRAPSSILVFSLYVSSYAVLVLSPVLLALDFMSFPFVILSFIQIAMFAWFVGLLRRAFGRPARIQLH